MQNETIQQYHKIDLSKNMLESVPAYKLTTYSSIVSLNISWNRLLALRHDFSKNLPNLEVLDLSHNQISSIHSGSFSQAVRLTKIDLSSNMLKSISEEFFIDLLALRYLNLASNQIAKIDPFSFTRQANLELLSVADNQLRSISPQLSYLQRGKLVLSGNPWVCDCDLLNFERLWKKEALCSAENSSLKTDGQCELVTLDDLEKSREKWFRNRYPRLHFADAASQSIIYLSGFITIVVLTTFVLQSILKKISHKFFKKL